MRFRLRPSAGPGHCQPVLRAGDDHTDTTVEGTVHFVGIHVTVSLQPGEDGRPFPALAFDNCFGVSWQNTRNVFPETATCDVESMDLASFDQLENRFDIDTGWFQQGIGQRLATHILLQIGFGDFQDLADQRETVGVRTRGSQSRSVHHRP